MEDVLEGGEKENSINACMSEYKRFSDPSGWWCESLVQTFSNKTIEFVKIVSTV